MDLIDLSLLLIVAFGLIATVCAGIFDFKVIAWMLSLPTSAATLVLPFSLARAKPELLTWFDEVFPPDAAQLALSLILLVLLLWGLAGVVAWVVLGLKSLRRWLRSAGARA